MRGGAEQHRLLLQQRALFAMEKHLLDHIAGLVGLVTQRDQTRFLRRGPLGPEVLREAFLGEADDAVGGGQDWLGRAIVAVERDDLGARGEMVGEVEDVTHGGGAKRVDRLRVVADHGEAASLRPQRQQDRGLQAVAVLIFVDQHMVEALADFGSKARIRHHLRPVQEQVVVIEHLLRLLGFDIG